MFEFSELLSILKNYSYGTNVVIDEKANDGKAKLELSSQNPLFAISLSHKMSIKVFKHQKVADWIVIEFLDETFKSVNLHLIELKRTITDSSWAKAKEQLKGALEHSFLLKGLFEYKIEEIFCYTAYVNDNLSTRDTTNPVLLKNSLGNHQQSSSLDWNSNEINIHNKWLQHKKIQLELVGDTGKGVYSI